MGCVTSKVMTRTGSFQEELSRSLKRRQAGSFPALQHLLVSGSTDVADGFLLVYDADQKQSYKPPSESSTSTSSQDIIINTWDLMAGLDDQEDNETVQGSRDLSKRSQSFHVSSNDTESPFRIKEDGKVISNISLRSKSFHTVDEYDAIMMERNRKPEMDWDRLEDFLNKVTSRESERKSKLVDAETSENTTTHENVGLCTSAINDDEKGLRRKTRANDLTSLAIPSTIEFPVIESLKSWIGDAETPVNNHSLPTDYMYYLTPKFGSFGLPIPYNREKEEECVLDPDMVSSLEVAMEQLQVEEEFLEQITKTFEDNEDQLSHGIQG